MKLYYFMTMNGFNLLPTIYKVGKKNLNEDEKKRVKKFKKQLKNNKNNE